MSQEPTPAVSVLPASASVGPQREVAEFGLTVSDPGDYTILLDGSADLAATLVDQDGTTVSAIEDGAGANPLQLHATLAPGTYTLRARAAKKGGAATVRVRVEPARGEHPTMDR
jgi:hypothetical protein